MKKFFWIILILVIIISIGVFLLPAWAPKPVVAPEVVSSATMSESEARVIAQNTCIKGGADGSLAQKGYYNDNSKTWWFDANLNATQKGCNPACVVSADTKQAEINYRCTGLIQPEE